MRHEDNDDDSKGGFEIDASQITPSPYILFEDDWKYFPTAIVHETTTNQSFVRYASLLNSMGVRNNTFMLALLNPDLQYVNPYNPHITPEEIGMIVMECLANPWYWFREILRAPAQAGADARMFEANRGNMSLYWLFFNHVMTFLIQPRQTGKSFSTDGLMLYLMNVACRGTTINLLTKDDTLRRANVQRLKDMREEIPFYFQVRQYDDANNTEEITVKRYNNRYITHVPQASPKRAANMGRGLTSEIFHIDEPPFQPNIEIALPAALAAGSAARDIAATAGTPWGTIFTTTSGKKDDKQGRYIYRLLMESAVWSERFLDARNLIELYEMIKSNSPEREVRVNATFSHKQLGKTDEWLARKLKEALQEGGDADRDFFNVWTSGSESSPFSPDMAEIIARHAIKVPVHETIAKEGYVIRWYVEEEAIPGVMAQDHHVLALDTSEAVGRDDISFVLTNSRTLRVTAAGTFNETNMIVFSQFLTSFIVRWKNVTTVVERRSTGGMMLDYLLVMLPAAGEDPFKRLYNRIVNEAEDYPDRFREINVPMARRSQDVYTKYRKFFGWSTSGTGYASRTELYGTTMQTALKRAADRINDKRIIDQLLGLVIKNGRIDHEDGEHDDMVIGWLLTQWLLLHGRTLSFYGIDSSLIATDAFRPNGERTTPSEHRFRIEQRMLRERIAKLIEDLSRESDPYIVHNIETQLRHLQNKVQLEEGDNFSVEQLIRDIKSKKREKLRSGSSNAGYGSGGFNPTRPRGIVAPIHGGSGMSFNSATPVSFNERFNPRAGWR